MPELSAQLPEIIAAAAKSPLGIFALMIISLAILGFFFFREASERTRIAIFVMLFVGVAVFGLSIVRTTGEAVAPVAETPAPTPTPPADESVKMLLGTWSAVVTYFPPTSFTETFEFELVGGEVMAQVTFLGSARDVHNLKVANGIVSFDIRRQELSGDVTHDIRSTYKGQIHADRIEFVMGNSNGDPAVRFQVTRQPDQ